MLFAAVPPEQQPQRWTVTSCDSPVLTPAAIEPRTYSKVPPGQNAFVLVSRHKPGWVGTRSYDDMFRGPYGSYTDVREEIGLFVQTTKGIAVATFSGGRHRYLGKTSLFVLNNGSALLYGVSGRGHEALVRTTRPTSEIERCALLASVRDSLGDPTIGAKFSPQGWFPHDLSPLAHSFWHRGRPAPRLVELPDLDFVQCEARPGCQCRPYRMDSKEVLE